MSGNFIGNKMSMKCSFVNNIRVQGTVFLLSRNKTANCR